MTVVFKMRPIRTAHSDVTGSSIRVPTSDLQRSVDGFGSVCVCSKTFVIVVVVVVRMTGPKAMDVGISFGERGNRITGG